MARYLWMQPGVRGYLALVLGIPLAGNLNVVSSTWFVLQSAPVGPPVRPMGVALWIVIVAIFTAMFGLPLAIVTLVRWRQERVLLIAGIAATVLSLTPFWVGMGFFRWYAAFRGLNLSN